MVRSITRKKLEKIVGETVTATRLTTVEGRLYLLTIRGVVRSGAEMPYLEKKEFGVLVPYQFKDKDLIKTKGGTYRL